MDELRVGCLALASNAAVIQLPARKFPGIVIQGDSLSMLVRHAESIARELRDGNLPDATERLEELHGLLKNYQSVYESALEQAGIALPYVR